MRASFDRELTLSGHPAQPAKTRIPRGLFVTVGADFFRGHRRPELIENKKNENGDAFSACVLVLF
jgi:hypothetical protein